jgi:hypothetical protein
MSGSSRLGREVYLAVFLEVAFLGLGVWRLGTVGNRQAADRKAAGDATGWGVRGRHRRSCA